MGQSSYYGERADTRGCRTWSVESSECCEGKGSEQALKLTGCMHDKIHWQKYAILSSNCSQGFGVVLVFTRASRKASERGSPASATREGIKKKVHETSQYTSTRALYL